MHAATGGGLKQPNTQQNGPKKGAYEALIVKVGVHPFDIAPNTRTQLERLRDERADSCATENADMRGKGDGSWLVTLLAGSGPPR
jgi:hypothetical protein